MTLAQSPEKVDPWHMQRELMAASGQKLPATYMVQPGAVLYAALNMEEMSEGLKGLCSVLKKNLAEHSALTPIEALVHKTYSMLQANSLAIRDLVKQLPKDLELAVERDDLKELADGATDLMVTNAGFTLALGLPGPELYKEVGGSNLSKKNPDTGIIDKHPDGKWIKGREYREPDILKVLFPVEGREPSAG